MKPENFEVGKVYYRQYKDTDLWDYVYVTRKLGLPKGSSVWGLPIRFHGKSVKIEAETVFSIFDDWTESDSTFNDLIDVAVETIQEAWKDHVEISF